MLRTLLALLLTGTAAGQTDHAGTRLAGIDLGPYAVGFEVSITRDPTRRINATDAGTDVALAMWYPAAKDERGGDAMTALDYRLLELGSEVTQADRRRYAEDEAALAVAVRHIGIVPLTQAQALASLDTAGIGRRGLTRATGRFPLVLVFGGPYYLSSTAEMLASHGFAVAAPFRFKTQSNEIGSDDFTWSVENSVRDGEWAWNELRRMDGVDAAQVSVLGHGGGGLQSLLFAMRNPSVAAIANIDAGNFSTRTEAARVPFYRPRLLRSPYLYVATAETRKAQDQFEDFLGMPFSRRFELTLQASGIRHHDLSDIGRAVTEPLRLRGDAQAAAQAGYATVQETLVRFFQAAVAGEDGLRAFEGWVTDTTRASGVYTVTVHRATTPAPTLQAVLTTLGSGTATMLREAHRRDPMGSVFSAESLEEIAARAMTQRHFAIALEVIAFARSLHADARGLLLLESEALESTGDGVKAAESASACVAGPEPRTWNDGVALARCRERLQRLRDRLL